MIGFIAQLLGSRKFVVALTTLLVAVAARLGLPADVASEVATLVVVMGAVYVGAQGYADGNAPGGRQGLPPVDPPKPDPK